jgi:hypothetical protein
VEVNITPIYQGDSLRPSVFKIDYTIDGKKETERLSNSVPPSINATSSSNASFNNVGKGINPDGIMNNIAVIMPAPVSTTRERISMYVPEISLPTKRYERDHNPYVKPQNPGNTGIAGGMVRKQFLPFIKEM